MLKNLEEARQAKNITLNQIALVLGLNKYQTVSEKIRGISKFSFDEAVKVQRTLFPEYDLVHLFTDEDDSLTA